MAASESEKKPKRVRGVERSVQVQVGELGGFDLRPTRFFVWTGEREEGNERVLPLGSAPRSLLVPRRPRELDAGPVHVRTLGNPVMTVALAGAHVVRRLRRATRT
jgi:hypothetical protein